MGSPSSKFGSLSIMIMLKTILVEIVLYKKKKIKIHFNHYLSLGYIGNKEQANVIVRESLFAFYEKTSKSYNP